MNWIKRPAIILMLLLSCQLAGAAAAPQASLEQAYNQARSDYNTLKNNSDPLKWQALAQRFMALYDSQPQSKLADKCLFWTGRIYGEAYVKFKRGADMDKALQAYNQLISRFPNSNLADDAQFNKAELYKAKGDLRQAYLEYLKVTTDFAKGDMKSKAVAELDKLEAIFARQNQPVSQTGNITTPPPSGTPPPSTPTTSKVQEIRQWSVPGYARVVLNLEGPAPYSSRLLRSGLEHNGEKSVQLDLKRAQLASSVKPVSPAKDGLLTAIKYSAPKDDEVRVVITLKDLVSYKVFTLDNPFRLVVDCFSQEQPTTSVAASGQPTQPTQPTVTPPATQTNQPPSTGNKPPSSSPPPSSTYRVPRGVATDDPNQIGLAAQLGLQIRTVVIDPGHGGKDPGATNGKIQEKNITLDLSKRVASKLRKALNCTVLLTRDKDVFLPLEERTAFANTKGADLFVSVHVNSAANGKLQGIETYFLNLATDEDAMRVAARENATTQRSLNDLQVILNDLMLNSKVNESNRLARMIHKQMLSSIGRKYKVSDLKVKQAPFYVLIGARMPAVLCEVGFLSNATERSRLTNSVYLDLVAEGIVQGIVKYNNELHLGGK